MLFYKDSQGVRGVCEVCVCALPCHDAKNCALTFSSVREIYLTYK